MFRSFVSILCLTLSVGACARDKAPVSQPASQASTEAGAQPAAAQSAESRQATAAQESVGAGTTEERGHASLEHLAALPASQQLPNEKWKLGTNYKPIVPPQPTDASAGKVEVLEVFWYGCPHCNVLEPYLAGWAKKKPDYIQFVKVPVMWSDGHRSHARLFYTLEALGRHDLHQKVFTTIHQDKNMLLGKTEAETLQLQQAFAKANGLDLKKFMEAYNSFSVAANMRRAEQLTQRYQVQGVPEVVINGKYTTDVSEAGGPSQLIELIDDLAASERRR